MKIRIKKVPQQAELNAKKWKHDDGGYIDIPNLLLPPTKENLIYSGHKSWYNK